jgi:hypothetical protein
MMRRRFYLLGAVLAAIAIAGLAPPARADYGVQVYDDGVLQSGITTFTSGNQLVFLGSTTHFSITNGSGSSNNPGTQGGSQLSLSSNETISTTFGGSGGTHTIQIVLSQTGWMAPNAPKLALSSSAGGSVSYSQGSTANAALNVIAAYQGFLDNTNTLYGMPGSGGTPVASADSGNITTPGTSSLVFAPGTSTSVVPGGTPFSMTDVLTFTFTLAAGSGQDSANVSASTVAMVPAPPGLILGLTGLPALGFGAWLRRRMHASTSR